MDASGDQGAVRSQRKGQPMASVSHPKTAQIIPFPVRRGGNDSPLEIPAAASRPCSGLPAANEVVIGSGWYHDAAIAEAVPGRKL